MLGGVKRIGQVTEKLVPFMALLYIVLAVGVIVINIRRIVQYLLLFLKVHLNHRC